MYTLCKFNSWAVPSYHVARNTCCTWSALDVLHMICTWLRRGHLSVRVGDGSRRSKEIVKNLELCLGMRLLLLLLLLLLYLSDESCALLAPGLGFLATGLCRPSEIEVADQTHWELVKVKVSAKGCRSTAQSALRVSKSQRVGQRPLRHSPKCFES